VLPQESRGVFGGQVLLVTTKWLWVARVSAEKARQYRPVSLSQIKFMLKHYMFMAGDMMFSFSVNGDELDFAENIHSVVKKDTLIFQPKRKQNPEIAEISSNWPYSPTYTASCVHFYDLPNRLKDAKIDFIVIEGVSSGIYKETVYQIDLSKMR